MNLLNISNQLVQDGDLFIREKGMSQFHVHASSALKKSHFLENFNLDETIKHALQIDRSTPQNFKSLDFSDYPLTISRGEHCFIDLYFWRRRPTTIHNHHFSGAFMGLLGKNVDLEFTFEPSKQIGENYELGELKLLKERNICPGDVVAIAPLDGFIHQNHHQANLTVNLCFRSLDIKDQSLSGYLFSGLRFTKEANFMMRLERLKRLLEFGSLDQSSLGLDEAIGFYIQNFDSGSAHPRFLELKEHCQKKGMEEVGINLQSLLETHWRKIEDLEELYE